MSTSTWSAPSEAASQLATLTDSDLLLFVRSLPWCSFLDSHIPVLALAALLDFVKCVNGAASPTLSALLPSMGSEPAHADAIEIIRAVYTALEEGEPDLNGIIDDVRRNWSARTDDEQDRLAA